MAWTWSNGVAHFKDWHQDWNRCCREWQPCPKPYDWECAKEESPEASSGPSGPPGRVAVSVGVSPVNIKSPGCRSEQKSNVRSLGRYTFFQIGVLSYVPISTVVILGENTQFTSSTEHERNGWTCWRNPNKHSYVCQSDSWNEREGNCKHRYADSHTEGSGRLAFSRLCQSYTETHVHKAGTSRAYGRIRRAWLP